MTKMKFDVPLQEACEKHYVRRSVAMRWLSAKKNPLRSEMRTLPSGRIGRWVNEQAFLAKRDEGKAKSQVWAIFYRHCLEHDADPTRTLAAILQSVIPGKLRTPGKPRPRIWDADFCRAAIKLVLDENSAFLDYLTEAKALDGTFDSEVARLLRPFWAFRRWKGAPEPEKFQEYWSTCRRHVEEMAQKDWKYEHRHVRAPHVVERDYLHDGRPEWLNLLPGGVPVPKWALRSVLPFKIQTRSNVSHSLRRMDSLAAQNSELRNHLPTIVASIEGLPPRAPQKGESATTMDPATRYEISKLTKQLSGKPFNIPEEEAVAYCLAVWTRVHRDIRKQIKDRLEKKGDNTPDGSDGVLPRSAVNRIFNLSRAA